MIKCPVCQSLRFRGMDGLYKCKKCGYTRKSMQILKKEFEELNNTLNNLNK